MWREDIVPNIRWRIIVKEGEMIPPGYGIAWYGWEWPHAVAMPIPLNLIAGSVRSLWWWIKCPPWRFIQYKSEQAKRTRKSYFDEGFEAGYRDGLLRSRF